MVEKGCVLVCTQSASDSDFTTADHRSSPHPGRTEFVLHGVTYTLRQFTCHSDQTLSHNSHANREVTLNFAP